MFLRLFAVAIILSATLTSHQDISGGAARIFGKPDDPEIRRQAASRARDNNSTDAVEDALELANSARNANPPRYHDAETAYRLAAKLNPKDPRPMIGLGNIWYDQKQFAAAATMYQQALALLSKGNIGSLGAHGVVRGATPQQRRRLASVYASLGIAQLQTENFVEAQAQFDQAISSDSEFARWHALRGYSLMKQGKTNEAKKSIQEALRLEPENADYKTMLESIP